MILGRYTPTVYSNAEYINRNLVFFTYQQKRLEYALQCNNRVKSIARIQLFQNKPFNYI